MWHRSVFAPPDDALLNRTLASALADIAKKWPDAPAVIDRNAVITFAELTCRAGGLAAQLSALRAEPGPVALLQKIGVDVVAAWFACALAGRPFVLLEPNNPPERNRALMAQAGVRIVVSDEALDGGFLAGIADVAVLHPDGRFADMAAVMAPDGELACDAPAMIFPTSGSTGEPKLITYSARTLQAKVQASIPLMGVHRGDRVLIAGSHSNYGFLHHALVFLLSGGALLRVAPHLRCRALRESQAARSFANRTLATPAGLGFDADATGHSTALLLCRRSCVALAFRREDCKSGIPQARLGFRPIPVLAFQASNSVGLAGNLRVHSSAFQHLP